MSRKVAIGLGELEELWALSLHARLVVVLAARSKQRLSPVGSTNPYASTIPPPT
jgi:hypothetical protein